MKVLTSFLFCHYSYQAGFESYNNNFVSSHQIFILRGGGVGGKPLKFGRKKKGEVFTEDFLAL